MWDILRPVFIVLLCDAVFLVLALAPIVFLSSVKRPAYAVFKRNFVGYFMNPTGYAFLVLFVFLCSLAQFWPHEFFNSNMATLDQLSSWFPLIMLTFIPAITMSIWADERRQGTDEILLTLPANDFDIVIGKYLSTAAIFTVSLLFSQITILFVLDLLSLGKLDTGLFISTYIGYWLAGLAMLALGMVGSFLTSNITISFMLAALINLPLVAASWADTIVPSSRTAQFLSRLSIAGQLKDFQSGVVSLSSTSYFLLLIGLGLFLSMVLIGRRHWMGGRSSRIYLAHYVARAICLVIILVGANVVFAHYDLRPDLTREKVNRLHPDTLRLIDDLDPEHPIVIEAYISQDIPELFAPTRRDLVTLLRELDVRGGDHIEVRVHENLPVYSDAALRASQRYGIEPETITTMVHGTPQESEIILGAALTMGLDQEVIPFFESGVPVEYELIRSIVTLAEQDRKKIGVVKTDAQMMGGENITMSGIQRFPRQQIIDELAKQYEIVEVDPTLPIDENLDALLVVQPSSLTQAQIDNLVQSVSQGMPTAIFEDPLPLPDVWENVPGTDSPRQSGDMFGQPPEPKGSLRPLWELLGVNLVTQEIGRYDFSSIIWQDYNPYPQIRGFRQITPEWVFINAHMQNAREPFSDDSPVTAGLEELLLIFPGAISHREVRDLEFTPLVRTGRETGIVGTQIRGGGIQLRGREQTGRSYVLAARIQGRDDEEGDATAEGDAAAAPATRPIDVILVSDIDVVGSFFLGLRARPNPQYNFRFDNVTFVLNVMDALTGEDRFMEIRKHKRSHATLEDIELRIQEAQSEFEQERIESEARVQTLIDEANAAQQNANSEFQISQVAIIEEVFQQREKEQAARGEELGDEEKQQIEELRRQIEAFHTARTLFRDFMKENPQGPTKPEDQQALRAIVQQLNDSFMSILEIAGQTGMITLEDLTLAAQKAAIQLETTVRRQQAKLDEEQANFEREDRRIETELEIDIQKMQNNYKLAAVIYPPIPPLLIGLMVFIRRRVRENVGASRRRMR